jgi:hypothetical protein
MGSVDVPCCLKWPLLQFEPSLSSTPVSRTVVDPDSDFSCLGDNCEGRLPPA